MNHAQRIQAVQGQLTDRGKDAFLAVGGPDCFYLSGFYTESGESYPAVLIPAEGEPELYVSSLDRSAADDSDIPVRIPESSISDAIVTALEGEDVLVGEDIGLHLYGKLDEQLSIEVDASILEELRMVKDKEEVEAIKRAYAVAENAISALKDGFEGGSEREIAAQLEYSMRMNGSDGTSFPTIAASGAASATPHHATGDDDAEGALLLDLGARVNGYVSDISRTLHLGEPEERYREVYRAVLAAHREAAETLADGVPVSEVDGAARTVLEEHGLAEKFIHSTGHGVGISVHEPPNLHADSEKELEAGMVVTIEPGVYIEDAFGVRIEDGYVVQDNDAERLTSLSRELEDNIVEV